MDRYSSWLKWAARYREKAARIRKLKEKREKRKGKKAPGNVSDNSTGHTSDGIWAVYDQALSMNHSNQTDIILDTGASHHIFNNRSLFVSIISISRNIQTASGELMTISGVGSVKFKVLDLENSNRSKTIEVKDVWYLPSCTKNLISGSQLTSAGFKINSNGRGLGVYSGSGSIVATARCRDGL